jgi:hypothetical protein
MNQKNMKIAGYVVTGLLTLMMIPSGIMQAILHEQVVATFHRLQIDNLFMMRFLGCMKLAGAVGLWVPRGRTWAIHGFTFLFCGALICHIGVGDPMGEMVGATLGLCLVTASQWFAGKTGNGSADTSMFNRRHAA